MSFSYQVVADANYTDAENYIHAVLRQAMLSHAETESDRRVSSVVDVDDDESSASEDLVESDDETVESEDSIDD